MAIGLYATRSQSLRFLRSDRSATQHVDEYTAQDYPIELNLAGGGGTRCSPIFEWFDENGIPPIALIIFTDLEIDDFPRDEPPYPVLWAPNGNREAPFGEVVM
jgi:predicted metal-dependent peptidase